MASRSWVGASYDEAVREAVIVVWEASDRICGKRLKAALPNFVDSMERHGHLSLDPVVRERLLSASTATLDRLLRPIRATAGSPRKRRRRTYMGSQIPVRTYNDWNWPPPGFLEIDLVAHCGGNLSGSFIHSLVATDICTGWTEAVPLLARVVRVGRGPCHGAATPGGNRGHNDPGPAVARDGGALHGAGPSRAGSCNKAKVESTYINSRISGQ